MLFVRSAPDIDFMERVPGEHYGVRILVTVLLGTHS